jgi:hypothetical protein
MERKGEVHRPPSKANFNSQRKSSVPFVPVLPSQGARHIGAPEGARAPQEGAGAPGGVGDPQEGFGAPGGVRDPREGAHSPEGASYSRLGWHYSSMHRCETFSGSRYLLLLFGSAPV